MPSIYPKMADGKKVRGVWYIQIEAGSSSGRRKRVVRQFKGSKEDAKKEMARLMVERGTGAFVEPSKLMLGQFLERWLEHVEDSLAPSTFVAYRSIVRHRWAPALGQVPLQRLGSIDIARTERQWRREGRIGRSRGGLGKGLEAKTVLNFHRVLADALAQAVRWKLVATNVADEEHMDAPRAERKEQSALSFEEAGRLFEAMREEKLGAALHTLLGTGLRAGEVLGLRWRDVDLEGGSIRVIQQYDRVSRSYREVKSHRSRRPVAIDAGLVSVLRQLRDSATGGMTLPDPLLLRQPPVARDNHTSLVFVDEHGRGLHHDHLRHALDRALARAGLEHLGPHGLRHTHASLLIGLGAHMKLVQERLGHASFGITADTYSHLEGGMQRLAADLIGAAFNKEAGHAT